MFMEFEEGRGALQVTLLLEAALGLDFEELVECSVKLAGKPLGVHAKVGQVRD